MTFAWHTHRWLQNPIERNPAIVHLAYSLRAAKKLSKHYLCNCSPGIFADGCKIRLQWDFVREVIHAVGDALKGGSINDDLASMAGFRQSLHPLPHLTPILLALADLIHLHRQTPYC